MQSWSGDLVLEVPCVPEKANELAWADEWTEIDCALIEEYRDASGSNIQKHTGPKLEKDGVLYYVETPKSEQPASRFESYLIGHKVMYCMNSARDPRIKYRFEYCRVWDGKSQAESHRSMRQHTDPRSFLRAVVMVPACVTSRQWILDVVLLRLLHMSGR
jgi:hypothetical protein